VMGVDSSTHPVLIGSLVDGLAEVGRLRNLGTLRYRPGRRPVAAANSAYRVMALEDSWIEPDLGGVAGPILLVDAETDTGWTFTMAARMLRQAGAESVLPFALACAN